MLNIFQNKPFMYIIAIDNVFPCKIGDIFKVKEIKCLDFRIKINGAYRYFDESYFVYHHPINIHKQNKNKKRKIGKRYREIIKEYHHNNGVIIQPAGYIRNKEKFK